MLYLFRHGHPEMKFEETKCASAEQTETNNSGKVEWGRDKSTGDDTLNVKFSKEKKKTKPSLLWAMLTTYSGLFVITVLYKLINDILTFTAPKIMELVRFRAIFTVNGNKTGTSNVGAISKAQKEFLKL